MNPDSVENRAVEVAKTYYRQLGYTVQDVTRVRGHKGYDLLATKNGQAIKIEVKGCTEFNIPDPYSTEFELDETGALRLVADFLCVVFFSDGRPKPEMAIIPREKIPPEYVRPKAGFRFSGKFKNSRTISKFLVG